MPIDDAYHFTLRFRVPDHEPVWSAEASLPLPGAFGHDRLELRPEDGRALGEARRLFVSGQGYDAEGRAREAGERARRALLLAAVESCVGIEWDQEPERGLSVWKGGPRLLGRGHFRVSASATAGVNADAFRERFGRWLARGPGLGPRQEAAAELLAAVHFDASDRSRLLVAYAAIEELGAEPEALGLEPPRQSAPHLTALDALLEHLGEIEADPDPAVDRETKRKLREDLRALRSVQGAGRCRKVVEDVLGEDGVNRFRALARVRNDIAHKGLAPPEAGRLSFDAYALARDLLLGTIAREG